MRIKGIYFFYRLLLALISPLVLLYFLLRSLRNRRYFGTLWQRLGFLPPNYRQTVFGSIWLHAVSVGEVLSIVELVKRLRAAKPEAPLYLSTSTLAGRFVAEQKLAAVIDGIFYAPVDYVFAVRRVLRRLRPSLVIVFETEIWPNLFREVKRIGCGLLMVNARISDRTSGVYSLLRHLFGAVLRLPDAILAQSQTALNRFVRAGAPPERVSIAGNLKYDIEVDEAPPDSPVREFFARNPGKLWIAASTTADGRVAEEDIVIDAFRELPGWKLLIAPRKPERFDEVAAKLKRAGIAFVRRTNLQPGDVADVLLLDTIGELSGLFPLADVVFMGGTLADRGGHNILEPAAFGKPVIVGPHMENFQEIAEDFCSHGALVEIDNASQLRAAVTQAANNCKVGVRARTCALSCRGATDRALTAIRRLYAMSLPCYRRSLPARLLLAPLAWMWKRGSSSKRRRDLRMRRELPTRVISVGNITVGGTGKTPFTLYLAEHLKREGRTPGILSRGYGRTSHHRELVLEPGAAASVVHTGDEPQIFLRSGLAHVGIGADRFATGWLLQERFNVDTLILDDGFQHVRLARQTDIVLIDALDPLGGCELLPVGRLREPLAALERATHFVITRSDLGRAVDAIEYRLHQLNARAPVFRSRIVPEYWVENTTGERFGPDELPFHRTLAFCGLGNPDSFWRTLGKLGIHPLELLEYGDHHAYTPRELLRMTQQGRALGVEAFLTTEKDAINLCAQCDAIVHPIKLVWLRIKVEMQNEEEFLRAIGLNPAGHGPALTSGTLKT